MTYKEQIDLDRIPQHVAIIMDGNGRWAKQRGQERSFGHQAGAETVHVIAEEAAPLGIRYLTLYTFSTENWNRPQEEVDALMHLISIAIERETPDLVRNNVRLKIIGDTKTVPDYALDRLRRCEETTASCTGMWMVLAISYSSRWEITDAVKRIAAEAAEGKIDTDSIDEATISSHLATAGIPDPDLMIRTGGDCRVSNYLLWQIAYSELIFTDTFWPDYTKEDFCDAILRYQSRERRFGKTSEQVNEQK